MSEHPVFTIGYGGRTFEEFAGVLRSNGIQYLIDVRSQPFSRFSPEFSRDALKALLRRMRIRYVFMGDTLGGRPSDPECYTAGRVDYNKVRDKIFFHEGIGRIRTAWEKNLRVVLMCSEGKPHECHRSKLLGRTLVDESVPVVHLDERGQHRTQEQVMALIEPQHALFDSPNASMSRKQYRPPTSVRERPASTKVVTIGAYGFNEESFFGALRQAGVDTFCDLRMRRGMRGQQYAFVNSTRLQQRLSEMGIRYVHCKELAPAQETRDRQAEADRGAEETKRTRTTLGQAFIDSYQESRLTGFDASAFLRNLGTEARTIALFCVEREPRACHRTLVSDRLVHDLQLHVEHIQPCEPSLLRKP